MVWFRVGTTEFRSWSVLTDELELSVPRRVWGPDIVLKRGFLDVSWS